MNRAGLIVVMAATLAIQLWHEAARVLFGLHGIPTDALYDLSCIAFAGMALALRSLWPLVFLTGSALNSIVASINDGMPVLIDPPAPGHIAVDAQTRLVFFSDWIRINGVEASPGDVLVVAGLFGAAITLLLRIRRWGLK